MKKRPDLIVGLSVIVTAAALLASVIWMKQSDPTRRRQRVIAQFSDVGNARIGNAAVIRGVRAGRIQRMEIADDGAVLVHLSLDRGAQLPADPVVLLNESSLFGEWQATIMERSGVPRDETVLRQIERNSANGHLPGATLPDIAKLTVVAGQIAGDVAEVASRVDVAFDAAAAAELRATIRNFSVLSSTLTGTVKEHRHDLDTLSRYLGSAVRALDQTARSTQAIAERVDSSTTRGELRKIITDLSAAAEELHATTSTLNGMSKQLAATQQRLDRFLGSGDSVLTKINSGQGTLGRLLNDSSLYIGSDSLVTSLRGLVGEVRANPKKFFNLRIF